MNLTELQDFVKEELAHLTSLYPELYSDLEKRVYAQTVKLSEETGELSEAVLHHFNRLRKSKSGKTTCIEEEAADVIIVTMLICECLDINIETALRNKITKLKGRRALDR